MSTAAEFFYVHGGYSYDPEVETPDEGHRRTAAVLADAEAWARETGLTFQWEPDPSGTVHVREFDCYEAEPETCEVCTAYDADGEPVASLGCIDDATDAYRRVVEAELAHEARPEEKPPTPAPAVPTTNAEKLEKLAQDADENAARCSQRGDTEGSYYARGLRDAYRNASRHWSA